MAHFETQRTDHGRPDTHRHQGHIEGLATADGRYYLAYGRTGDRPVPAAGNRFPDRATARAVARATEQYRSALRRYDPQVPYYNLIVCEETSRDATTGDGDRDTEALYL